MSQILIGSSSAPKSKVSITILLADDSEIVRKGIRQLLTTHSEIEILAEAADFAQTIQMTNEMKPQVVVMDLYMPDETSFPPQDVKSHLKDCSELLAISLSNDENAKALAESLGATILLDKANLADTLIPSIVQLSQKRRSAASH
jgi:two-component system response regulator DevR